MNHEEKRKLQKLVRFFTRAYKKRRAGALERSLDKEFAHEKPGNLWIKK